MPHRDDFDDERWWRYEPTRPIAVMGGIKSRSQRGQFAEKWWGRRWLTVLESFGIGGRLSRGRSYARSGQVLNLNLNPGIVEATVQGSRTDPYQVKIALKQINGQQRAKLGRTLAVNIAIAARLMGDELPPEIEQCFQRAGAPLFPHRAMDLTTWCSCPDASNPCKHIAAVYYLLAEEFDRDPFLLLQLRGIGREEFMAMLAEGGEPVQPPAPDKPPQAQAIGADPNRFWRTARIPSWNPPEVAPSLDGSPMARRLGNFPLWRGETDFLDEIARRTRAAAGRALEILALENK